MSVDRVFEFGVALAASVSVNRAAPGGPLQDPGWTFEERSIFRMEPHR